MALRETSLLTRGRLLAQCGVVLVFLAGVLLAGCSAGPSTTSASVEAASPATRETPTTSTTAPSPLSTEPRDSNDHPPIWRLDNLTNLDTLLSNADGCAYYYIFDPIPAGLKVAGIGSELDMDDYSIDFENEKKQPVYFYVFTTNEGLENGLSQFDQMLVDGITYYYQQGFDDNGELYVAYFQWLEDGHVYLVHPQETITPATIRKYNHLRKVEFNIGQQHVGLDTGIPLISDSKKIERIDRENEGIRYFTGPFPRL